MEPPAQQVGAPALPTQTGRATKGRGYTKTQKGICMSRYTVADLAKLARTAEERGKNDPERHRCFVSYHLADIDIATQFVADFGDVFIPTVLGVTDEDDFVDSTDENYIKQRIRDEHLRTTTVTIVIAGKCTWSRKFVDWEIASSLRDDPKNKRSGLLILTLPGKTSARLSQRIQDNWVKGDSEKSYAEFENYPSSDAALTRGIEAAFQARSTKSKYVDNSLLLMRSNVSCP